MHDWRKELYELAAQQHGVVGLYQIRQMPGSVAARMFELNGRGWSAPFPSVRARNGAPRTPAFRASCAVLQMGLGAALSFDSAAAWWGLSGFALEPFQVVRQKSATAYRCVEGISFRETRRLPLEHLTMLRGVAVVRPERLPFELIQQYPPQKVEVLIDRMLQRRMTSTDRLHQLASQLGGKGATGIGHIRRFLKARPRGYIPPESGLESRLKWIAEKYVLPPMRPQVNLGSADEWIARVDFLAGDNVAIWVQSELYHTALVDKRKDELQRTKLMAEGFVVLEVWQNEIWDRPELVAERIRKAVVKSQAA